MACALIVFAKAPLAGQAKTRLAPALGLDGAARLAQRLLAHAVAQALASAVGPVHLCIAPGAGDPFVDTLAARHGLPLQAQEDGDLGTRMARALRAALAQHGSAMLMGSDAPALDAAVLRTAAQMLQQADAVAVPSVDGGYALIGLQAAAAAALPALFQGMRWSHAGVMQATRDRAAAAGLRLSETSPVHDIDVPADLVHLPPGWLAAP